MKSEIEKGKFFLDFDLEKDKKLHDLTTDDEEKKEEQEAVKEALELDFPTASDSTFKTAQAPKEDNISSAKNLDFGMLSEIREKTGKKAVDSAYIKAKFRVGTLYRAKLHALRGLTIRGMSFSPDNEEFSFGRYDLLLMGLLGTLSSVFEPKEVYDDSLMPSMLFVTMHPGSIDYDFPYKVIEFNDVSKGFGDRLLFEHLTFSLPPAGIVGVIGPNGAGKTTLFRLIMGIEQPDSGSIDIGETVKISYVDQQHKSIDPDKTVYETIAGNSEWVRLGGKDINARAWVSRFNFTGADQEKLCGVLSGGERNRLHLALTLKDEGNVLLLDEPTNDVDVNTIRALEDGLESFAGCAVVVSHDRWFLDRIATHILAFEGEGKVVFFDGNYSEYEENKKARLGNVEPKRFKYKKLMD